MPNQYLDYGCCNIVDGCRTLAYAKTVGHAIADPIYNPVSTMNSCNCCVTPSEEELPAGGAFVSPISDPAPWYEPTDPRSGHYLGAMIRSWKESQPYLREAVDTTTGGRTKRAKLQRKEIAAQFVLFVDDPCAIEFAKTYFLNQFVCNSSSDPCSLPTLEWHECYNPSSCDSDVHSMRGLVGVSLSSLNWLEDEIPSCYGIVCDVVFAAEKPWTYEMCPENIVEDLVIVTGEEICNICEDPCPALSTACENPCLPLAISIPKVEFSTCYCEPWAVKRQSFAINADPRTGESTLDISIFTGSYDMRNFRIKGWSKQTGSIDPNDYRCEDPCIDIVVPGPLPANSVIEVDGVTQEIWVTCNNVKQSGRSWVETPDGSPLTWPDISCDGLVIVLEASALVTAGGVPHTAPDATITIDRYHRELR